MPTEKPRYTITLDEEMLKKIDDFRFENRFPNRTQATLELIRIGIETLEKQQKLKTSDFKEMNNLEKKSVEELEAEYKKSRSLNVKKMDSSASNISADTTDTATTPKNEFKAANQ